MKHRHISYATRYNPGYTAPQPTVAKKGKFPGAQKFNMPHIMPRGKKS
jgi:hypothetical protein